MKQDFSSITKKNINKFPLISLILFTVLSMSASFPWTSVLVLRSPVLPSGTFVHTFTFSQPDSVGIDLGESTVTKTVSGIVGEKNTSNLLANIPIIAYWGGDYRYPLRDTIYTNQTGNYTAEIVSRLNPLTVEDAFEIVDQTLAYKLYNSFPNPATNGRSTIVFDLYKPGSVRFSFYNISGQRLASQSDFLGMVGTYSTEIDLSGLANGVYFYRLETEFGTDAGRLLVLHNGGHGSEQAVTISPFKNGGNRGWQNVASLAKKSGNGAEVQTEPSFWESAPDYFVLAVREPGFKPMEQKVFHSGTATAYNFIIEPTDSQYVT
ncbi:MAG: T9SS C-terminal target domain-containing protein, partial [Calditrichaeota bacterium]